MWLGQYGIAQWSQLPKGWCRTSPQDKMSSLLIIITITIIIIMMIVWKSTLVKEPITSKFPDLEIKNYKYYTLAKSFYFSVQILQGTYLQGKVFMIWILQARNLWLREVTQLASNEAKNQILVYLIMCSVHFPLHLTESEVSGTI